MPVPIPPNYTAPPKPDPTPVAAAPNEGHPWGDVLLGATNVLRGLIGAGDDSSASRFGGMLGAAVPFLGGVKPAEDLVPVTEGLEPHVKALVDLLHQAPEPKDPTQLFASEGGVAGYRVQQPQTPTAPAGFQFPDGAWGSGFTPRDPAVAARQTLQDNYYNALGNRKAAYTFANDTRRFAPSNPDAPPMVGLMDQAPAVKNLDDLKAAATQGPAPQVKQPLIQNQTASMRGKNPNPRTPGGTPVNQLSPDVIEQIQRAAGTGSLSQTDLVKMFPQVSPGGIAKIVKMPWNWK